MEQSQFTSDIFQKPVSKIQSVSKDLKQKLKVL